MNKKYLMAEVVDIAKTFGRGFSGVNPTREWFGALGCALLIVIIGGAYAWQAIASLSDTQTDVSTENFSKKRFLYGEAQESVKQFDEYQARFEALSGTQESRIEVYVGEKIENTGTSSTAGAKTPVADKALLQVE